MISYSVGFNKSKYYLFQWTKWLGPCPSKVPLFYQKNFNPNDVYLQTYFPGNKNHSFDPPFVQYINCLTSLTSYFDK
jgi:hypothetical protein